MSPPPTAADQGAIVLFDATCLLCLGAVRFVIRRDPRARIRFAALHSATAGALLAAAGVTGQLPDSVVLLAGGRVFTRSAAMLEIARRLRAPWPLLGVLRVVPRCLRDWVYDQVARRRYRWFGRNDACGVPTPEVRGRLLD